VQSEGLPVVIPASEGSESRLAPVPGDRPCRGGRGAGGSMAPVPRAAPCASELQRSVVLAPAALWGADGHAKGSRSSPWPEAGARPLPPAWPSVAAGLSQALALLLSRRCLALEGRRCPG